MNDKQDSSIEEKMTADELAYWAEEKMRRMMNPPGFDDMMNADMMRKNMDLSAFESMQEMQDIAEKTANYPALEAMRNED